MAVVCGDARWWVVFGSVVYGGRCGGWSARRWPMRSFGVGGLQGGGLWRRPVVGGLWVGGLWGSQWWVVCLAVVYVDPPRCAGRPPNAAPVGLALVPPRQGGTLLPAYTRLLVISGRCFGVGRRFRVWAGVGCPRKHPPRDASSVGHYIESASALEHAPT